MSYQHGGDMKIVKTSPGTAFTIAQLTATKGTWTAFPGYDPAAVRAAPNMTVDFRMQDNTRKAMDPIMDLNYHSIYCLVCQ